MSEVKIVSSGSPLPAETFVTPDNKTIFGNGTAMDPLRAGAQTTFNSVTTNTALSKVGAPVYASGDDTTHTAVADGISAATAFVAGLISSVGAAVGFAHDTTIQSSGPLVLTTAEWDTITGQVGGLTPGAYWLSAVTSGGLTTVKPAGAGTFATLVGIAINATTMIVMPSVPIGPHA